MILSDREIRALCADRCEKKLITPFVEDRLQAASYDVTMSCEIWRFKKQVQTISLDDQPAIDAMYEAYDLTEKITYVLMPGEYVLVTLNEHICLPENIIAHIRSRTKFTRAGILITGQHCNPTYEGVLKIGLRNVSPNAIELKCGLQIGQLVFEQLASTPTAEKWYCNKQNAAYQGETEFIGAKFGGHEFSPAAAALYAELMREIEADGKG